MAPGSTGTQDDDAKNMFDRIGKDVYDKVKEEAKERSKGELEGKLSFASIFGEETVAFTDPCDLINDKVEKLLGTNSNRYPCANRSPVRFSDESRSQCTYNRIKDSQQSDNKGACAPFRRLSLCDRNLELMKPKKRRARHNLLAEVCMAAKYEAQSLEKYRAQYEAKYGDVGSTICTVLARSFADIGDIIRGKDLYLGYDEKEKNRRKQLENNLKEIFTQIHEGLSKNGAQKHYNGDTKDYFQLREDWWALNRDQVWKAITCDAPPDAQYFRGTCVGDGKHSTLAKDKCRCEGANIVPTYFDYVPQYLRWFEEWAEDFCRKRKHKLVDAIKKCRGEGGNDKYCSRNGYDCTQTIRGKDILVEGDCTKCSVVCTPFVDWIENKQKEFEKQKKKYDEEIKKADGKNGTTITTGNGKINNLYVGDFYKKLQAHYPSVNEFLKKLNDETTCKGHPEVEGKSYIDFTESTKKTFSHTEYCETCPWCAKKEKTGQVWKESSQEPCTNQKNRDLDDSESAVIRLLLKDKTGKTMVEKLGGLCGSNANNEQYDIWKCYYDKSREENSGDKDYCVLQDGNKDKPENRTIRPYYVLFLNWIDEMLKDSIVWSKELDRCIKNEKESNCIRECKSKCDCFKKWVGQKEQEWEQLEKHYEEEDFGEDFTPYGILEMYLKNIYLEMIQKDYPQEKLVQKMKKIIEENSEDITNCTKQNNSITTFLQHEEQEAKKCKENNPEQNCKKPPKPKPPAGGGGGRSLDTGPPPQSPPAGTHDAGAVHSDPEEEDDDDEDEDGDDSDNEDEEKEEKEEEEAEEDKTHKTTEQEGEETKVVEPPKETTKDVDPCKIVDELFKDGDTALQDACTLKYGPKAPTSWKCVPTTSGDTTGDKGSICVPPRRRRLYVGKLQEWANTVETQTSETSSQSDKSPQVDAASPSDPRDGLRDAFIQSAAVETFFLWHRYKKEKEIEEKEQQELFTHISSVDEKLQKNLQSGKIPDDFLRQMFYTLGDYRDILFGKDISGDKNIETIKNKIEKILPKNGTPVQKPNSKREEFWKKHGPDIWRGMICALSYDTETKMKNEDVYKQLTSTIKDKYDYKNVTFEGGINSDKKETAITTNLDDFVKRPPYFRWLEEWGEEFCRKKNHKLKRIKDDCRKDNNSRQCDDDGFECKEMCPKKDGTFESFTCLSCAKSCKSYKKWISTKNEEFNKQKEKYNTQIKKLQSNTDNIYDEIFVGNLSNNYSSVESFLKELKGPCSNYNTGECEIDFNNREVTFGPVKNCAPCSVIGVKCENGSCSAGGTKEECNGKTTITANDIQTMEKPTEEVVMRVSDNSGKGFKGNGLEACQGAGVFEGIRKDEWKCGEYCGVDICTLEKTNNGERVSAKENDGKNQIILIRVLFKRWLESFLEDYNKINDKISHCINNSEKRKCIEGCKDKCKCVDEWIKLKYDEWKIILERYIKQYSTNNSDVVYEVKSFLQQGPFHDEVQKAIKPCTDLDAFEDSNECTDSDSSGNGQHKKKDVVECLLNKLKEKIDDFKRKYKGETQENCPPQIVDTQTDTSHDTFPVGFAPTFCNVPPNPCSDQNGTNIVSVTQVAQEIQKEVHEEMLKRSVDNKSKGKDDKSCLEGDISQAEFKNGAKGSDLKGQICNLEKKYTNTQSSNGYTYEQPCKGKDSEEKMFEIENGWLPDDFMSANHKDLYMPPRRRHFCTSNLEHLDTKSKGLKGGKAIHSLLGDVLLSANKEAGFIKDKYKNQPTLGGFKDEATICRAIKYSFADIGDIIKGTDLWELNYGQKKTQDNLKEIFCTIHKSLDSTIKEKYNDDNDNNKYINLRTDWWEANRRQVWNAMKCHIRDLKDTSSHQTSSDHCGYSHGTPLDDYIPQRLRWMTEWAEWYCKLQSQEYEKLKRGCDKCKNGICENGKDDCSKCTKACNTYKQKIKKWEEQWTKIKGKYEQLYQKAEKNDGDTSSGTDDVKDENDVVAFLSKLQEKNKGNNTIYSTAAGYIHQEAHISDCQKQTRFCKSPSDNNQEKYAFRTQPHDHDDACICHIRYPEQDALKGPCEIIDGILNGKSGTTKIDGCEPKNEETYPQWKCDDKNLVPEDGICMPPRRQKLCLYYLEHPDEREKIKTQEHLRDAFIKSAGVETFLSWNYYKSKNNEGAKLDNTLKNGNIPPEFLRSMFYTFGYYIDLLFGTDISTNQGEGSRLKDTIDSLFPNGGTKNVLDRENWWKEYGPSIWKGMLCGLSHHIGDNEKEREKLTENETYQYGTLKDDIENFVSRPPFLRWFTEWGEDFCKKQKKELVSLKKKCDSCTLRNNGTSNKTCDDNENCGACKTQCEKYKKWIGTWKKHYSSQKKKFQLYKNSATYNNGLAVKEANSETYKNDPEVTEANSAKHARDYLKTQLENMICTNGNTYKNCDYTCMNTSSSTNSEMPASLDYTPSEYKDKCNCVPDECSGLSVTGSGIPDGSAFGGGLPPGKCKGLEGPQKNMEPPTNDYIYDILKSTIPVGIALALGSITFLFIKKKTKSTIDLLRVINIPKSDYDIPTKLSPNRYIPYTSGKYRGKRYIYLEGDSGTDSGYTDHYSDITSSSESEYEEMDINDIYVPGSPKYKTLIEVVLEPSGKLSGNTIPTSGNNTTASDTQNDIQNDGIPSSKITDNEWNTLKHDFISQYLQSEQPNDVPNDYKSGNSSTNTNITTTSRHNVDQKPFITSIHDRDLYTGEEYNYDMSTNSGNNDLYNGKNNLYSGQNNVYSGIDPTGDNRGLTSGKHDSYSGIDLINDTLSGNQHIDIYDELLKRKENELFGTNHVKQTSIHSVAKLTNSDPIHNQLELFHKWLDRHRDMCEQWENHHERLAKLKEEWENETHSGNIHTSDSNKTLNTDVSIQIHMDDPKPINEFTYVDSNPNQVDDTYVDSNPDNSSMDTILEDLDKPFNEPYYYDMYDDDIYYDVNDHDTSTVDTNAMDVPSKVQIEMDVNTKLVKEKYPIGDVWDI